MEHKIRSRMFQARNVRTGTGAPATSRSKGESKICERKHGVSNQWKAKRHMIQRRCLPLPPRHEQTWRKPEMSVKPLTLCLVSKSPTSSGGENTSKGGAPCSRNRVKSTSRRLARIHRVTIGILLSVTCTNSRWVQLLRDVLSTFK